MTLPTGLSKSSKQELILLLDEVDRRRARKDPVFFIERYLKTFDPRPEAYPHHLDFTLYDFQKDYVLKTIADIREGRDIFDEKSRDMGISWLSLAIRLYLWLFDEGYQSLIGSRKESYVDNGTLDSLFGKLEYFLTNIRDPLLLPEGFDIRKHRTYMRLLNPVNGNVIKGESSNKNFSRGGRYKDVFFDEFGFWPDAQSSWTAAGDATRCRHAVTTPPDEPSYAKSLRFSSRVAIRTWHWRLHPHKDEVWYEQEKRRRSEEEVLHELDISWEYSVTGRPYPEIMAVPFRLLTYEPDLPLYLSLDLGLDALAVAAYQPQRNSQWINVLEAFESSNKVIEWYFPFFGLYQCVNIPKCPWCGQQHDFDYTSAELEAMARWQHFGPAIFFGDPSGKSRHIESGVSPYAILRQHGIEVQVNDLENEWVPRRDATKRLLPRLVMNDTPGVRWMHECIKDAHYPKRPDNSQAVTAISKPVHDWTSHHRSALEFFSVNYKGAHDPRAQLIDPAPVPGIIRSTTYRGEGENVVVGERIDIGGILRESHQVSRDWRNS